MKNCPFCNPETDILYEDDVIRIIRDKKRKGNLIISKRHVDMSKEGLEDVFEIHARDTNLKDSGHVSVEHLHIFYST